SDVVRRVDVRLVAATHQDLDERVQGGRFRADLFYRLNVVPIRVPPLRAHREDVPLLVERFLGWARERNPSSPVRRIAPEVGSAFMRYGFPGNVRELENLVERLVIVGAREEVSLADLEAQAPGLLDAAGAASALLADARQKLVPLRQLEAE